MCLKKDKPASGSYENKALRVLVVDDNVQFTEIISKFLTAKGFYVEIANDGKSGYNKYIEDPEKYDVILMDIQMPVMNGYEAVKCIRESACPNAGTIPVIAVSGETRGNKDDGFDAFLGKPFNYDDLYSKIISLLK